MPWRISTSVLFANCWLSFLPLKFTPFIRVGVSIGVFSPKHHQQKRLLVWSALQAFSFEGLDGTGYGFGQMIKMSDIIRFGYKSAWMVCPWESLLVSNDLMYQAILIRHRCIDERSIDKK